MSEKIIKTVTAKVIFISDGHVTEVEAALCDHGDYGFNKGTFDGMSSKQIHDRIVGETFAAGAAMYEVSLNTGKNKQ
jgi:hypothetical protein